MKFGDMPYRRITLEEIEEKCAGLTETLRAAKSAEECMAAVRGYYALREDMTAVDLCSVRHDMNVNDGFYAAEQDYYDEIMPKTAELFNEFDGLLLRSPYRTELEGLLGKQAFITMENGLRSFDNRLVPLMVEENALAAQYNKIASNMTVNWRGEKVKTPLMATYLHSRDRETRKAASLAVSEAWEEKRGEIEDIYHSLVQNRNSQAQALGMKSYSELSCLLMNRTGYGLEDIARFRESVKKHIAPLNELLEERRRKRLGLDKLRFYDKVHFPDGDPVPVGDTEYCLDKTREMYHALSRETAEFIDFILDNDLYDAEIRDGKRGGGYMQYLEKYRAPFIFANFDGTSENAYIMCHEGGHAFQAYLQRNEEIRHKCGYTSESAETHAMAMEFFAAPYMELFFGERADDYRTMHLEGAVRLVVYECQQDEFQRTVYDNPETSPEERNALWARLGREYFPSDDYSGNDNLERGCGWQRIEHNFCYPFYTVDYALAQVCALEYRRWAERDKQAAWNSYLEFCRRTGGDSFPNLTKAAGLDDPFAESTLKGLADWIKAKLEK
ncbi:MAG: M3 family oligoendopeptidase [Lachnospiraceae bacterium]|nr:M3 family oligoendopeptidase [Ruminococcus sp.]MCM1274056.1 M3 family oligoendopeptidase [Lachnospiraceae bacterium]